MDDNLEFADICRICLSRNNHKLIQEVEYLIDLFRNITNIQIDSFDELPQNICNECIEKLVSISNFIALSKQNDALLRRSFQNKILIKTELDLNADDARNIEHQETDQKLNSEIYIKTEPDLVNQYENECDLDFQITEPELCKSERELMEDVDSSDEVNFIEKKQTKPKTNRHIRKGMWSIESMEKAIAAVKAGKGKRESARNFGIPYSTLKDRIKLADPCKPLHGRSCIFTDRQEKNVVQHCLHAAKNRKRSLSAAEYRRIVFEYAERNQIKHRFDKESKMAGQSWFTAFLKRHPILNLNCKKPSRWKTAGRPDPNENRTRGDPGSSGIRKEEKRKRGRPRGKAKMLTATPDKVELDNKKVKRAHEAEIKRIKESLRRKLNKLMLTEDVSNSSEEEQDVKKYLR